MAYITPGAGRPARIFCRIYRILMKKSLVMAGLLAAGPLYGAAPEPAMELKGYLSSWTQSCPGGACSLPKPGERNRLGLPSSPGEASAVKTFQELALPGGGVLSAGLDFFAICPYAGRGNCAGRYFQAQVSLSGPAGAFCAAALNPGDFDPFPVLMCAGLAPDGTRFGVTLHRLPL